MAEVKIPDVYTISAVNQFILSSPRDDQDAAYLIQLTASGLTGSITVKGRVRGATTLVAIPYTSLHLNGVAGTGAEVSTAITGTSLIKVAVSAALEVVLDCTAISAGSMAVNAHASDY